MADSNLRLKENKDGKFFVDNSCSGCDVCVLEGPEFFSRLPSKPFPMRPSEHPHIFEAKAEDLQESIGKAYVTKQPETEEEIARIREIMSICPTNSIGESND